MTIPFRRAGSALYFLLVGGGLSMACRDVVTDPITHGVIQLSQAGAIDRPFAGSCQVSISEEVLASGQVQVTGEGTCELTHLGRSAYRIVQTGAASSGSFTGTAVFTAANGDELHASFGGLSAGTGSVTFTGGTGRFRSATGSASFARGPGKKNGPGAPGLADRYDGTLRFDPSGQEPAGEEPVRFTLETGSAVSGSIGPEGGTLTTRSAAGGVYTFSVPANALLNLTTITMTPIAAAQNLPLSGGLAGGVQFQPAGLRFLQPASLQLTIGGRPAGAFRAWGLHYADGESRALPEPVLDGGNVVTMTVSHFSPAVVGWGTDLDVEKIAGDPANGAIGDDAAPYRQQILALSPGLELTTAVRDEFSRWFRDLVLTPLGNATQDFQLFLALAEYWRWWEGYVIPLYGQATVEQQFAQELAAFDALAAPKLQNAIQGNLAVCRDQNSLTALANALFWWQNAVAVLGEPNVLPTQAVLRQQIQQECARVVLAGVDLPQLLETYETYLATLEFAVDVGVPGSRTTSPFSLTLVGIDDGTIKPVDISEPRPTATDAAGLVQFTVTALDTGKVGFTAQACLVLPDRTQGTPDVCLDENVLRTADSASTITVAVTPSSVTLSLGASQQFTATVSGTGNTAVTWTATGGTITAGGLYTAGAVPGSYTVRATSAADPTLSAIAQVTIGAATPITGTLTYFLFSDQLAVCSSIPLDLSGSLALGGANVSGTFAGLPLGALCNSGEVTGTLEITISPRGNEEFDGTMKLKFLTVGNGGPLVDCEFAGPVSVSPDLTLEEQYSASIVDLGKPFGFMSAFLAPTSCPAGGPGGVGNGYFSVTFFPKS